MPTELTSNELTEAIGVWLACIAKQDFIALNDYLDPRDIPDQSTCEIVGLVRVTFKFRYKLDDWAAYYLAARAELDTRREKTDALFAGLN